VAYLCGRIDAYRGSESWNAPVQGGTLALGRGRREANMNRPLNFEEYASGFPNTTQKSLKQMRATIRKAAPRADEVISYGMPGYRLDGALVWFAGFAHHIGFYPGASGIVAFKKELSEYQSAKGSVQFSLGKPLPLGLIAKIVKFRAKENLKRAKMKKR
jgi:uncharacterized protein YdhG (YjbR/CyaY superfamily)